MKKFWNSIPNWLPLYITYTYMLIFPTCPWLKTRRKKFQCKIMSVVFPNEYITGSRIWTLVAFYMACAPPLSISLWESCGLNLFEVAFECEFLWNFISRAIFRSKVSCNIKAGLLQSHYKIYVCFCLNGSSEIKLFLFL